MLFEPRHNSHDVHFLHLFGDILDAFLQLDAMLARQNHDIDSVLNFDIPDSVLEERITGRWVHMGSGRSYHSKFAPPKVPGKDDVSATFSSHVCMPHSFIMNRDTRPVELMKSVRNHSPTPTNDEDTAGTFPLLHVFL